MLKYLITTAADPVALKMARRFHPVVRENIYRASAISSRALQLIDVFPVLGIYIYSPPPKDSAWDKSPDAIKMVERGVRLNQIAAFMDILMWGRRLKPAEAHLFGRMPGGDLHWYLPDKTWEQRIWLRAFMSLQSKSVDPEFAYWLARNVLKMGNRIRPVLDKLSDTYDWTDEARREEPRCITRLFSSDMSWETVRRETEKWHEALATTKLRASNYKIPVPWFPAAEVNGYEIVPLDSSDELWKEGAAMHNCVGTYDRRMAAGECYVYSVRQGGTRIVTVELVRDDGKVKPGQMKAACNKPAPKEVAAVVRMWLAKVTKQ
jgi:PcfJ-like protein